MVTMLVQLVVIGLLFICYASRLPLCLHVSTVVSIGTQRRQMPPTQRQGPLKSLLKDSRMSYYCACSRGPYLF